MGDRRPVTLLKSRSAVRCLRGCLLMREFLKIYSNASAPNSSASNIWFTCRWKRYDGRVVGRREGSVLMMRSLSASSVRRSGSVMMCSFLVSEDDLLS